MAKVKDIPGQATKPITNEDPTLTKVVEDYKSAYEYVRGAYHKAWDDAFLLYNNKRTAMRGYDSVSDTFIPMTFGIIETLVAHVTGGKPKFTYLPTKKEQETDTKALNLYVDYIWDKTHLALKVIPWIRETLMYGTGVLMVEWDDQYPCVKNIPLKDFFVDPTATDADSAAYMGYRYLTTKWTLENKMVLDPDSGKMVKLYSNLDQVHEMGSGSGEETDRQVKDMFKGSTLGASAASKQVEVLWICYKSGPNAGKVLEVANRMTVIRNDDSPYKADTADGDNDDYFFPFAIQRNYTDASLFYGKGDIEPIAKLQELLNDTANQKIDNISYVLDNMWTLDPAYADKAREIESVPGAVYTFPEGALQPIEKPQVTGEADKEIMRIKTDMREATAADEVIQGNSPEASDVTATQINAQVNQAGQRFALKLQMLEAEGYQQLATIIFKLIQLYVTDKQVVRVVGSGNKLDWKDFNPKDYMGEYEPRVQLDATVKSQQMETAQKVTEMVSVLINNPLVNQTELIKFAMNKGFQMDEDEAELLLSPDDNAMKMHQAMMMQQAHMQQAMAPPPPPPADHPLGPEGHLMEQLNIKFETLSPDVQSQILTAVFGITPQQASPTEQKMNLEALKLHNEQTKTDIAGAKAVTDHHKMGIQQAQALHAMMQPNAADLAQQGHENTMEQQQAQQEAAGQQAQGAEQSPETAGVSG